MHQFFILHFIPSYIFNSDGRLGISILPLAVLLTGTLFIVGIAVLFVVVIAVRKRREQGGRTICDDKDKHLGIKSTRRLYKIKGFNGSFFLFPLFPGMDVTVTAPLETGAGHQRLVIAYTLKQAIEKQPDILNAQQKMQTASTTTSMNTSGVGIGGMKQPSSTSSSPLSNRPNALFIGKPTFTSSDYVSINLRLLHFFQLFFFFSL